jgi:hypothetical protein
MNIECNRIGSQLASTINGEAWYGNSVQEILAGITAAQACAHPIADAHSIWELVCHLQGWVELSCGAAKGTPIPAWPGMPHDMDWPVIKHRDESAWRETVGAFFASYRNLEEIIRSFGDERLDSTVPGRTYNFSRLFEGMIQHAIYHSGQIAILKKALATDNLRGGEGQY